MEGKTMEEMQTPQQIADHGFELAKQGNLDEAYRCFEKAHIMDHECYDALYGQGAVWYKRGDYYKAREYFTRVLDGDPTHIRAQKYLQRSEEKIQTAAAEGKPLYEPETTEESTPSFGDTTPEPDVPTFGTKPAEPPSQEPESWFKRHKMIVIGVALVIFLILVAVPVVNFLSDSGLPEPATVDEGFTAARIPRSGSLFGTIISFIGMLTTLAMGILFLIAAFQDALWKGFLCCLSCGFYQVFFLLFEYKDPNKWTYVGLYFGGIFLMVIGNLI